MQDLNNLNAWKKRIRDLTLTIFIRKKIKTRAWRIKGTKYPWSRLIWDVSWRRTGIWDGIWDIWKYKKAKYTCVKRKAKSEWSPCTKENKAATTTTQRTKLENKPAKFKTQTIHICAFKAICHCSRFVHASTDFNLMNQSRGHAKKVKCSSTSKRVRAHKSRQKTLRLDTYSKGGNVFAPPVRAKRLQWNWTVLNQFTVRARSNEPNRLKRRTFYWLNLVSIHCYEQSLK
jgi:hypothetical protein